MTPLSRRLRAPRTLANAAVLLLVCGLAHPAAAATFDSHFDISIAGFLIGESRVHAEITDGTYKLTGEGKASGLSRIITDARGTARGSGRLAGERVVPASYGYVWEESDDRQTLAMELNGNRVTKLTVDPPEEDKPPEPDRVVLTDADKRGITDPVSALVWKAQAPVDNAVCDRTVPIFDGEQRYDVKLSFKRRDSYDGGRKAYDGVVFVCRIDYTPIAGHRKNKREIRELRDNDGMEVWLAPLPEPGGDAVYMVPVRIKIPTRFGLLDIAMDRLAVAP
ncbi:DUF3108 domain-containing protein [Amorphus sp. 3PC139-8]|uniref:DUF3108 domain-containing protein n=1 Tax=Amorphus sp. 3PC139-8 TaxID=2735676 RepID=UPI00345DBF93